MFFMKRSPLTVARSKDYTTILTKLRLKKCAIIPSYKIICVTETLLVGTNLNQDNLNNNLKH